MDPTLRRVVRRRYSDFLLLQRATGFTGVVAGNGGEVLELPPKSLVYKSDAGFLEKRSAAL